MKRGKECENESEKRVRGIIVNGPVCFKGRVRVLKRSPGNGWLYLYVC